MNIARNFVNTANRLPHKVFLVSADDSEYSYGEILSRARRFASVLELRGVSSGDRVILSFPNSVDYLTAYLGTLMLGCTALPIDFRSRPKHLEYVSINTGATMCVVPVRRSDFDSVPGELVFPDDLEQYPELPFNRLCPDTNSLALIMFTSGATGVPKGVCLTHNNLQHTINSIVSWAGVDQEDRELTTLSLTHLFGLAHCHIYWTLGGTVFVEDRLQNIPRLLKRIERYAITSFPGTPGGFRLIIDQFPAQLSEQASKLKYIIINSAPMDEKYVRKLLSLLPNTKVYMYYGLTEASRSSYICYNDDPDKLVTVGRPTPGTEIVIGSPSRPMTDEVGEILIRGPHLTSGYWGIDSSEHYIDGWFKTGDLGVQSQDGFLTWKGRVKEQINIDGLKLSPTEVEDVLMGHSRVADTAVVGAPDPHTGECIVAFVVPKGDPDKTLEIELRRFCKSRLEIYKIPNKIIFVDEIPRTDTGKTRRVALRDKYLP